MTGIWANYASYYIYCEKSDNLWGRKGKWNDIRTGENTSDVRKIISFDN